MSKSGLRSIHHPFAAGTDGPFPRVKKPERETDMPIFTAGVMQSWKCIPRHGMWFHGEVIMLRLYVSFLSVQDFIKNAYIKLRDLTECRDGSVCKSFRVQISG